MGVGIFLLLVLSTVVVIIMLVMVVKRKAACKQKRDVIGNGNPYCNNTVVVLQEQEMQGVGADYNDAHSINQGEDEDEDEDEYFDFGYNPYEVNRKVHSENTMTPTSNVFSTPASATKVDTVHAVVDKNKKNGAKEKAEDEPTVINKDDLYARPMVKAVKMTGKGGGVVVSSGVEERERYDDVTKTDRITR